MSGRPREFKTVTADDSVRRDRIAKAEQFLQVAGDARELAVEDFEVTDAAVALLATVDSDASIYLNNLLAMKTRAGYGHDPISLTNLVRAERAARALMHMAQE